MCQIELLNKMANIHNLKKKLLLPFMFFFDTFRFLFNLNFNK